MQLKQNQLLLGLLFVTTSLVASNAVAIEVAADARSSIYQDTDHTFISTTAVGAAVTPIEKFTVRGRYIADIVTSASVDVVSAATGAFDELRHEGLGSIAYRDGTRTASLTYVYSVENDWSSHSISGSYSNDFWQHRLTVGLGGGFTANAVGRSGDPNFHRSLLQGSVSATVGLVATQRDLLNFDYTFVYLDGYQASPYRFVRISDPNVTIAGIYVAAPEAPPDTRGRHAVAARWNHAVGKDSALKSHVRGYLDDWGTVNGSSSYKPGQKYSITVTMTGEHLGLNQGNNNLNGMAITVEDQAGKVKGIFESDTSPVVKSDACPSAYPAQNPAAGSTYLYGDCHGVFYIPRPNTTSWTYSWTAPAAGSGPLTVFYGVVDGDADGKSSLGDDVKVGTVKLVEGP